MAYRRSRRGGVLSPVTVLTTVTAALIAGVALGGVLHVTGNLRTVAAVYGLEGVVNEWTLVFGHSVLAAGPFVALVNRLRMGRRVPRPLAESYRNSFLCACLGTAYGVVLWVAVIAYGAPFAFGLVTANAPPVPYRHWGAFYALLVFGAVCGAWYPLLREFFEDRQ
ncbi:hypothetical protein NP511_18230 [Natrinema thermotolerans]|uniref:Uncharacterized protein n=1 Tax=Natrinema thermotolerans TaxID=121872 RepID=A0AAF0P982_9EURY|nr:hypothetical protein [Natrinema thermotolerans]WMT07312.1 hypothetical protein NP511_18230 [Natrinema thermotolerans]